MGRQTLRFPLLSAALAGLFSGCAPPSSDSPRSTARTTLAQDLYGLVCNRLGASVLTEDLEGSSYHAVCFPDGSGAYSNTVDVAALPTLSSPDAEALRKLALAKLETLATRRDDLLAALRATFDGADVPVPYSPGQTIPNHEALRQFLAAMVPLYSTNPTDDGTSESEPLFPSVTRATGRFFAALSGPGDALVSSRSSRGSTLRVVQSTRRVRSSTTTATSPRRSSPS